MMLKEKDPDLWAEDAPHLVLRPSVPERDPRVERLEVPPQDRRDDVQPGPVQQRGIPRHADCVYVLRLQLVGGQGPGDRTLRKREGVLYPIKALFLDRGYEPAVSHVSHASIMP